MLPVPVSVYTLSTLYLKLRLHKEMAEIATDCNWLLKHNNCLSDKVLFLFHFFFYFSCKSVRIPCSCEPGMCHTRTFPPALRPSPSPLGYAHKKSCAYHPVLKSTGIVTVVSAFKSMHASPLLYILSWRQANSRRKSSNILLQKWEPNSIHYSWFSYTPLVLLATYTLCFPI